MKTNVFRMLRSGVAMLLALCMVNPQISISLGSQTEH